jgi:TatD DNase family protein
MLSERNQYVNLHAHREAKSSEEWVLTNINVDEFSKADLKPEAFYSVGIHPWTLEECDVNSSLGVVQSTLEHTNVIAIGETGLDKSIQTPMDQQIAVFKAHINIAEKAGVPVIIHLVKASQQLIQVKRELEPTVPMIIHGYRGSVQQAGDLVKLGFYLSLDHTLLNSERLEEIVKRFPLQKLFIETDDSDVSIKDLYANFAKIKGISIPDLQHHMVKKIDNLFV